jgi:hypothetical protein
MKKLFLVSALALTIIASPVLANGTANGSEQKGDKPNNLGTQSTRGSKNGNGGTKMSPRAVALKKCSEDYKDAVKKANNDYTTAVKDAKGKKGKERVDATKAANKAYGDALAATRKMKADCTKAAPKR